MTADREPNAKGGRRAEDVDGVYVRRGEGPIAGVEVIPKRRIPDGRGTVFRMLRSSDPHFREFGEIYFSSVYEGVVKAWKNHERVTVNYACIHGRIKVVLWDGREDSRTRGGLMEIFLGPDNHSLVVIPPGVWNGFQGRSSPMAIVANCATEPHDPQEFKRVPWDDSTVPYSW